MLIMVTDDNDGKIKIMMLIMVILMIMMNNITTKTYRYFSLGTYY